jgi:hypothetical protein
MLSIRDIEKHFANAEHKLDRFAVDRLRRVANIIDRDVIIRRRDTQADDQPS